uniref:Non-specific serine/threonine protein kinase n=1 Tax=Alexandrium monilatum TaxID=311494 RepID=A0A7S4RLT3_9DINO
MCAKAPEAPAPPIRRSATHGTPELRQLPFVPSPPLAAKPASAPATVRRRVPLPTSPAEVRSPSAPSTPTTARVSLARKRHALVHRHADGFALTRHYESVRPLGEGSFGRVELVKERSTGQERVCKKVRTMNMRQATLELMKKEVRVLAQLDHPHIVKLHEYAEDVERAQLILVLEYVQGGSCAQLLEKEGGGLNEALVARLVRQLLSAVAHCHEHGIVHRDIKPANMMLSKSSATRSPDCKVIDFGLAASSAPCEEAEGGEESGDSSRGRGWGKCVGTPAYMAPEVVDRTSSCGSKVDLWSVGVTCLELLTGLRLFQGENAQAIFAKIRSFRGPESLFSSMGRSPAWRRLSSDARDFVQWLLQPDPARRPSAAEALAHPWMVQVKATASGLAAQVVQSLSSYARAPPVVRDCLLAVAAGVNAEDTKGLDRLFMGLESDGLGRISWKSLAAAIGEEVGHGEDKVDIARVLQATDLVSDGEVSYTEFVAACLHSRFSSVRDLAARAFSVLDDDRDGKLNAQDIQEAFGRSDGSFVGSLPQDRAIGLDEWCERVHLAAGGASPGKASRLRLCVAGSRTLARHAGPWASARYGGS